MKLQTISGSIALRTHRMSCSGWGHFSYQVMFLCNGLASLRLCPHRDTVSACVTHGPTRTKRWMHSQEFTNTLLFYPREIALQRMPLGLPAGWELPFTLTCLIWEASWSSSGCNVAHFDCSISVIGSQFGGPFHFFCGWCRHCREKEPWDGIP